MMSMAEQQTPTTGVTRHWQDLYDQCVRPHIQPVDDGKFVAIDLLTGEYELDVDEIPAVHRLQGRRPEARVMLVCFGQPGT